AKAKCLLNPSHLILMVLHGPPGAVSACQVWIPERDNREGSPEQTSPLLVHRRPPVYRLVAVQSSTALDEPPAASERSARGWHARGLWYLACFGIVLLGFALRAAFYQKGYTYPDEPITREVVRHMLQSGNWDTNWAKADLEPHFRYDQYNFS